MKIEIPATAILAALCIFGLICTIWSLRNLIVDLKFYSLNNWDKDKESGVKMRTGFSHQGEMLSARQRFSYGHLIWISFGLLLSVVSAIAILFNLS